MQALLFLARHCYSTRRLLPFTTAQIQQISSSGAGMGGDCCGKGAPQNGTPQPGFAAALSNLEDQQNVAAPALATNGTPLNGKAAPQPKATHKDWVDKLKPYFDTRIQLFDKYALRGAEEKERARGENVHVSVTLPNGTQQSAVKGVTTPMEVAKQISSSLAKRVVVAKVWTFSTLGTKHAWPCLCKESIKNTRACQSHKMRHDD